MSKLWKQSLAIGAGAALFLFALGYATAMAGLETVSYVLYWQAWALEVIAPCTTLGSMCENPAMGKALFFAGLPLGFALYSAIAFGALTFVRRRRAGAPVASPPA
jgi:hypothetical protein